jgi:hypothetical protein
MKIRPAIHRTLESLRREGKALNDKDVIWDDIASELGIYTKDGRINPGLAYRIVMEGYEPSRPETRHRLGLAPICPSCKHSVGKKSINEHLSLDSIQDMPQPLLRWALEHREEMP